MPSHESFTADTVDDREGGHKKAVEMPQETPEAKEDREQQEVEAIQERMDGLVDDLTALGEINPGDITEQEFEVLAARINTHSNELRTLIEQAQRGANRKCVASIGIAALALLGSLPAFFYGGYPAFTAVLGGAVGAFKWSDNAEQAAEATREQFQKELSSKVNALRDLQTKMFLADGATLEVSSEGAPYLDLTKEQRAAAHEEMERSLGSNAERTEADERARYLVGNEDAGAGSERAV
jgi:hypothetical protein